MENVNNVILIQYVNMTLILVTTVSISICITNITIYII